jgi:hypothetical protein
MPQRFLKPGLATSKRFAQCSWAAQALFVRLITQVDDYGRMEVDPILISRTLYPWGQHTGADVSPSDISAWLLELANHDLVELYSHKDTPLLQIKRWTERARSQRPKYPAPGELPANVANPQQMLRHDNSCQQMTADDSKCCGAATNAAPPTSTSAATSTSVQEENNKGIASRGEDEKKNAWNSRTQFAALFARITAIEKLEQAGGLDEAGMETLKKARRALKLLQSKQAHGDFSTINLTQYGL